MSVLSEILNIASRSGGLYLVGVIAVVATPFVFNAIQALINRIIYQIPSYRKIRLSNGQYLEGPRKILGQGSFGSVFLYKLDQEDVAVKVSNIFQSAERQEHELKMLKKANPHPNVIRYITSQTVDKKLWIVTELMKGTLHDLLKRTSISPQIKLSIAIQIAKGIVHLHNVNAAYVFKEAIIHQDLKTDNIFVSTLSNDPDIKVKLGDFGLAREFESVTFPLLGKIASKIDAKDAGGTLLYIAPEVIKAGMEQMSCYEPKADVYSYGLILWELATQKRPLRTWKEIQSGQFLSFEQDKLQQQREVRTSSLMGIITKTERVPTYPKTGFFGPVIDHCIQIDPDKRYSARKTLESLQRITL